MQLGRKTAPDTFQLERTLKAPIERVWSYFVDADKRARWFTGGDDFTALGQDFTMVFAHHRFTDEKPPEQWKIMESGEIPAPGRILAFEPPRLLAYTWGGGDEPLSEVRFELTPQGERETLLVLTHAKIDTLDNLREFAGGWTAHVATLADALEGKPTNRFWAYVLEANSAYESGLS